MEREEQLLETDISTLTCFPGCSCSETRAGGPAEPLVALSSTGLPGSQWPCFQPRSGGAAAPAAFPLLVQRHTVAAPGAAAPVAPAGMSPTPVLAHTLKQPGGALHGALAKEDFVLEMAPAPALPLPAAPLIPDPSPPPRAAPSPHAAEHFSAAIELPVGPLHRAIILEAKAEAQSPAVASPSAPQLFVEEAAGKAPAGKAQPTASCAEPITPPVPTAPLAPRYEPLPPRVATLPAAFTCAPVTPAIADVAPPAAPPPAPAVPAFLLEPPTLDVRALVERAQRRAEESQAAGINPVLAYRPLVSSR